MPDAHTVASSRQSTRFGPDALDTIGDVAVEQGMHRALIVTDPDMKRSSWLPELERFLHGQGVRSVVSACVTPTPHITDVELGVRTLAQEHCDGVISFGGGSSIDVGKAVALLGLSGATVHEHGHGTAKTTGALPHIAVPTTAGAGAERSSYAFLLDDHGHEHTVLHEDALVPVAAIIDPRTHVSMPPPLTAVTGLNALGDAVEAWLSPAATEASDRAARAAMAGIMQYLPDAYDDGTDLVARTGMAEAAYHAAEAFDIAGLGIVDGISLALTALYDIGHSEANAIVLPHAMACDTLSTPERLAGVAEAMGVPAGSDQAVRAVVTLQHRVGVTQNLADLGVSWDDLYTIGHTILQHPFNVRAPHPVSEDELERVFVGALTGALEGSEARAALGRS